MLRCVEKTLTTIRCLKSNVQSVALYLHDCAAMLFEEYGSHLSRRCESVKCLKSRQPDSRAMVVEERHQPRNDGTNGADVGGARTLGDESGQ